MTKKAADGKDWKLVVSLSLYGGLEKTLTG